MLAAGCVGESSGAPQTVTASRKILAESDRGPVLLVLKPHPVYVAGLPGGLQRAAEEASAGGGCSAAVFHYADSVAAETWLRAEVEKRRAAGRKAELVLAGHSLGATEAAELARRLLRRPDCPTIRLLLTVDAVKTGSFGSATSKMAETVVGLGGPLPKAGMYFVAYTATPAVDGKLLLAHVNYYHTGTKLYHGSPIASASENYCLDQPELGLNHGNIDDFVYPAALGDLRAALAAGRGGE